MKKILITEKQHRLFLLLCLTTALDLAFVAVRMLYLGVDFAELDSFGAIAGTRSVTFLFLTWNLLLAWIPYLLTLSLPHLQRSWLAWPVLGAWLVFFPNAPYIVTDLLHVGYRPPVPVWYDTVMIFSYAWTGLFLGFLSLLNVQQFLEKIFEKRLAVGLTWTALGLCAFGVYLGRYQRWNTWDLVTNPFQFFEQTMAVLLHPMAYLGTLGLAVVMAGVMGVGYLTVRVMVSEK